MITLDRISKGTKRYPANALILDITAKDNPEHFLSPTWEMIWDFKNGKISWKKYKEKYVELLENRFDTRKEEFIELAKTALERPVVFRCYCPNERYCHRSLAKKAIERIQKLFIGKKGEVK